jgi:hypothetical protein
MLFTDQALDPRNQLVAFLGRQEPLCHKLLDHQDVHIGHGPLDAHVVSSGSSGVSLNSAMATITATDAPMTTPKRNRPMRLILPLAAILSTLAAPALAQEQPAAPDCQPAEQLKAYLASKYDESQIASGVSLDGTLVMVFSKPDHSTFTVVKVTPQGLACMVDVGRDWQTRNDAPAVPEQGS